MTIESTSKIILRRYIPAGFNETLKQVENNVNEVVEIYFDQFKASLNETVETTEGKLGKIEKDINNLGTKFDENLRQTIKNYATTVNQIKSMSTKIKDSNPDLTKLARELDALGETLEGEAAALDTKIKEAREKISEVGTLVGSSAKAALKTLAPIP